MNEKDIVDKIAETLDMVNDDISFVYDTENGRIIFLNSFVDNEEIEEDDKRYLYLPTQYDINEYSIMSDFAYSYPNENISDALKLSLHGKGAFRKFKDTVIRLGVREKWFAYRDEQFRKIAEEWCIKNGLI